MLCKVCTSLKNINSLEKASKIFYKNYKLLENLKLNSLYNEKISALNFLVFERKIPTSYGFTNVVIAGKDNKPPLIVLHGINSAAPFALSKISFLEDKYQIFAIDLLGQPNKSDFVRLNKKDTAYGKWFLEIINHFNFEEIEPFTIVLVDWKVSLNAYELVWDGVVKHFKKLDNKPKIWSSSTLYTNDEKQLRRDWFSEWLGEKNNFSQKEIINFHQDNTKGNLETSLRMKRSYVETVSITSVKKIANAIDINYIDLLNNSVTNIKQKQ